MKRLGGCCLWPMCVDLLAGTVPSIVSVAFLPRLCRSLSDFREFVRKRYIWNFGLEPGSFAFTDGGHADISKLTEPMRRNEREYRAKFPHAVVADLAQNPDHRPRHGENAFFTLTTYCNKIMHVPSRHIYCPMLSLCAASWGFVDKLPQSTGFSRFRGGAELAALHGMPVIDQFAWDLGTRTMRLGELTGPDSRLCHCASFLHRLIWLLQQAMQDPVSGCSLYNTSCHPLDNLGWKLDAPRVCRAGNDCCASLELACCRRSDVAARAQQGLLGKRSRAAAKKHIGSDRKSLADHPLPWQRCACRSV